MIKYYTKYTIFIFVWLAIIWFLSDQSSINIGLTNYSDLIIKKSGHIFVYTILGLLLTKAFIGFRYWSIPKERINLVGLILLIFVTGLIFAALDELHQLTVLGRHGNPVDVFIDSLGIIAGIIWGIRHKTGQLRHSWKTLLTK